MRIDIISVMPELLKGPFSHSILKRAADKGIAEVRLHNLREFGAGKHQQVDDYQYGGGAGMVMQCEPIVACVEKLQSERDYEAVLYMTPDGKRFDQRDANALSLMGNMILICGHYKGIDQRIRDHWVTHEFSIGDYVLSGGELAAAVITDAIIRLIPGVLNDETSALTDTFQDDLLAPPVYTRPEEFRGHRVPEILLSGNNKAIDLWREEQAYKRTKERRPDLLED
ncbi:MAG TPA: tRNA (guanosine(37)-N1)-methyltransferase TrmD [Cryomorphaceae bacterium]|nr:tRNA (guanosine(37)-N1)-methyltransferase TrmD [Cryomorphaceae bacterium]